MFERNKRKSFLFFGLSNHESERKNQEPSNRTQKQVRPLNKEPLSNKVLSKEDAKSSLASLKTETSSFEPKSNIKQAVPVRQATIGRRRPPPPIVDIKNLKYDVTKKAGEDALLSEISETSPVISNPTLMHKSDITLSTNVEMNDISHEGLEKADRDDFKPSHQRQKSEVEQLVDDLDHYITESALNLDNGTSNGEEHQSTHNSTLITNSYSFSDSESSTNVSPLYGDYDLVNKNYVNQLDSERKIEEDQFSFNTSINDSIQQLNQISLSHGEIVPVSSRIGVANASGDSEEEFENHSSDDVEGIEEDENSDVHSKNESFLLTGQDEQGKRNFRIVNEEKPNFYFNDSTTDEDNNSKINNEFNSTNNLMARSITSSLNEVNVYQNQNQNQSLSSDVNLLSNQPSTEESGNSLISPDELKSVNNEIEDAVMGKTSSTNSIEKPATLDKNVRLISSYVEELRLLYYPTSNSLQLPPDLPYALKNKNALEQPQNIKVTIRTSTRQVGIKHGKAKQKLLSLETTKEEEEEEEEETNGLKGTIPESTKIDHTKEFHTLFSKDEKISAEDQEILDDIPGDEAYDSDDLMAPLRENKAQRIHSDSSQTRLKRSDTISSYFTRNAGRIRSGTLDNTYSPQLPLDIRKYTSTDDNDAEILPTAKEQDDYELDAADFGYYQGNEGSGLHITNPDSD